MVGEIADQLADLQLHNDPRTLAPNRGQNSQTQSIPVNSEVVDREPIKEENPKENKDFQGVFEVGGAGLEPVTSTMSTSKLSFKNAVKHGIDFDCRERLHQCLHQIVKLVERDRLETLAEVLADSLEPDALERLADALDQRAERD